MVRVLVTGGAGFIGFHLAKHLAEQGQEVTIIDNFFRGKRDEEFETFISQDSVKFIEADLTDLKTYEKLDDDYDYVYHIAAVNGTQYFYDIPDKLLRINLLSTIYLLDWFKQSKCKKILFSSSSETYAGTAKITTVNYPTSEKVPLSVVDVFNPRWSYGGSKIVSELLFINYAKQNNLKMSIIRYANIYGPRMGMKHVIPEFIKRIQNKDNPFIINGGKPTRTFCYISDAVKATQKVMETDKTNNQVLNVGTSKEEIKMNDLAKKMFDLFNYVPEEIIEKPEPAGCTLRRCPDVSKLKELTGFVPQVYLDEGLMRTYEWYKNFNYGK